MRKISRNNISGGLFMKKLTYLLFLLIAAFLAACSGNETADKDNKSEENAEQNQEETEEKGLSVDKGLLNVEVTLPAAFFEGTDMDEVIAEAKKDGVKEVKQNEDGSITYIMSKAEHKKMVTEMGTSITEYTEELKNSEEYPSIKDVTHNKSFTEFTLTVDKDSYENSFDGFAVLGLGMQSAMYHAFKGANPDEYKVTISVKDEATQEVFGEVIYPDAFEEMGETEETEETPE